MRLLEATVIPTLPTVSFKELFHVGPMNAADKRDDSYEGSGLSVSLHPDEWRSIASGLVAGDTWRCLKPGNRFVASYKVPRKVVKALGAWGVEQGLATPTTLWRMKYYDDDDQEFRYFDMESKAEAEAEAEMYDRTTVKKVLGGGLVATPALSKRTRVRRIDPTMVLNLLLTVYAEESGYDGVWWADRLDPDGRHRAASSCLPRSRHGASKRSRRPSTRQFSSWNRALAWIKTPTN